MRADGAGTNVFRNTAANMEERKGSKKWEVKGFSLFMYLFIF